MKIKRFFAAEMREAIRLVKEELGPDAVILSNNKVDGGIELVAAIDYDEQAVQRHADSVSSEPVQQKNSRASKRSVFAKVPKPGSSERLEDSIQDDVISFTSEQGSSAPSHGAQSAAKGKGFEQLLEQSSRQQSIKARQARESKTENRVFSRPTLEERKQPFISDFSDFGQDEQAGEDIDIDSFNYETLLKEKQRRTQKKDDTNDWDMDAIFADSHQNSDRKRKTTQARKTGNKNSYSQNRNSQDRNSQNRNSQNNKVEWVQDPALTSMQEEIKSLRGILENQLSGLAWGDFARRHPHRAELLSRLYRLGLKSSLSEKIVRQLKTSDSLEQSWRQLLGIIARNIPTVKEDPIDEGGIIALVGPTGVGKTTNIAKLAARFTLKYGARELALVTTDSYRVGAHEQLKTYGRILGVPVYVANDEDELKQVLSRLDDKRLVLIDTAGMSHRDLRLTQQLNMLRRSHNKMKILAVLSAASQTLAMDEVIKTFNAEQLDGCIASKVDESTSIGGIISILIENRLQLNYISDGQKVPEDIHQANTRELLKQALEMVRQHPVSVKNDELAMSYSAGDLTHAYG